MGIFDRLAGIFRRQEPQAVVHIAHPNKEIASSRFGNRKYRWSAPGSIATLDYQQIRERGRTIYRDSTIAHGIVQRFVDTAINTGLTWEATPEWPLLPGGPRDEESRNAWTDRVESLFEMWASGTESDVEGKLSFSQMQRLVKRLESAEGETIGILRYLNSPTRSNPLAIQIINPDQVVQPYREAPEIEGRGGEVRDGIEYDATGARMAIWVQDDDYQKAPVRVPFFGPRSGRRFVVHFGNWETAGQSRGFPMLESLAYELSRLTEYDVAELEAVLTSALWVASIESDVNAVPGKGPKLAPNIGPRPSQSAGDDLGIKEVQVGERALIMNNLAPGYSMKAWQPSRPNANYTAFVEAFESRLAGALGMPRSVLVQKFQGSYSAARAEIMFYWQTVNRIRDDFIHGFLNPVYEAWFSEHVRSGEILAPGYNDRLRHRAWLKGHWDGISMPQIDPLKEVNAVKARLGMGHTTGEREAKNYNGSDYRANVERLTQENTALATANAPLNVDLQESDSAATGDNDDTDTD